MKKYIANLLWLCAAVFALTSCGDDDNWAAGPQADGVYFPNTVESTINISMSERSFDILLMRSNTEGEQTVNLVAAGGEGIYTIPSSAAFADGQANTTLTVTYDPSKLEYDQFTEITITIADGERTPYGMAEYKFQVGAPSPYVSIGTGVLNDSYFGGALGIESVNVDILQNQSDPRLIRIMHPYDTYSTTNSGDASACSEYLQLYVLNAGDTHPLTGETVTEDGLVYFEECSTGINVGQGVPAEIWYPGMLQGGEADNANCRVIAWQENGLPGTIQLVPFLISNTPEGLFGGKYSAMGANITINFPGYNPKDYALSVAYNGKYTNEDDEDTGVLALLNEVGADVTSVRLALVEGLDASAAIQGMQDGTLEYTLASPTEGAVVRVPFADTPVDGTYTLVALAYDGNEAQTSASATFKYTASSMATTWTLVGTGDYTYSRYFATEDEPYLDEGLNLYVSDQDPTRFKIENWGMGMDFEFTYDEATGKVTVLDQMVDTHPTYGAVFVNELADYAGNDSFGLSHYENGTFHFNVVYYCGAGEFGMGYETFTLNTSSTATAASKQAKKATRFSAKKTTAKLNMGMRSYKHVMGKVFKR